MEIVIEKHFESKIEILRDADGNPIVKKTYDATAPVIRFLNSYLKNFYSAASDKHGESVMPVVMHEYFILKQLEPYNIAPRALGIESDCLYMTFEGNSILSAAQKITREEFLLQAKNILHILHSFGIRHNDLTPSNVLFRDWTLKIIDFTLADFGKVDIVSNLPDRRWAYLNQDYNLLNYRKYFPEALSGDDIVAARTTYKEIAATVYNYHNLGVNNFHDAQPEKTPHGGGERYNFDRMAMMVMNFDFYGKAVVDLGCNSGWFLSQIAALGAKKIIGVDYEMQGIMGKSIRFAKAFAAQAQAGIHIVDQNLETIDLGWQAYNHKIEAFDATIVFSVLHHIRDKQRLLNNIFVNTREVIFYEDHEFWNELYDDEGRLIEVQGSGYRFDWNKDLSWREKMASLARHEPLVINGFMNSWRREALLLDRYSKIKLLGFSEKFFLAMRCKLCYKNSRHGCACCQRNLFGSFRRQVIN